MSPPPTLPIDAGGGDIFPVGALAGGWRATRSLRAPYSLSDRPLWGRGSFLTTVPAVAPIFGTVLKLTAFGGAAVDSCGVAPTGCAIAGGGADAAKDIITSAAAQLLEAGMLTPPRPIADRTLYGLTPRSWSVLDQTTSPPRDTLMVDCRPSWRYRRLGQRRKATGFWLTPRKIGERPKFRVHLNELGQVFGRAQLVDKGTDLVRYGRNRPVARLLAVIECA